MEATAFIIDAKTDTIQIVNESCMLKSRAKVMYAPQSLPSVSESNLGVSGDNDGVERASPFETT